VMLRGAFSARPPACIPNSNIFKEFCSIMERNVYIKYSIVSASE
jgi:hypothetical protein